MKRVTLDDLASMQAVTQVNAEQASKSAMQEPTRRNFGEGCQTLDEMTTASGVSCRGIGDGMHAYGNQMQHGKPQR